MDEDEINPDWGLWVEEEELGKGVGEEKEMGQKKESEEEDGKEPVLGLQPFLWHVLPGSCVNEFSLRLSICAAFRVSMYPHAHGILKHMCMGTLEEDIRCLSVSPHLIFFETRLS